MLAALVLAFSLAHLQPMPGDSARSDAEIREFVLRHVHDVRRCYQTEGLSRNPALAGVIEVELTIQPTGVVKAVRVDMQSFSGSGRHEVASCVATAARHWRFQRGPFGTEIHVLPFSLAPQHQQPPQRSASSRA